MRILAMKLQKNDIIMNMRVLWMKLRTTALCLMLCGALAALGQETGEQFSVATLNVDGLPQKILVVKVNPDGPGDAGTARIGKYLVKKDYDLVMLQEDFNYHDVLAVWLEDDYKMDEWTGDVDVVGRKIDYIHLQNHRFECDGLLACWKNDLAVTPVGRTPWQQNFGKFSHALDEMVTKGFRRYEVTLRGGDRIVVYNMHMDASDSKDEADQIDTKDKEARLAQWKQLKDDVMEQLDTRPVIITGDLNTFYGRDDVKREFIDAINESGRATVADVWVELHQRGVYPDEKAKGEDAGETLDKILYINPVMGTRIQPVAFSVDRDDFLYNGKPLGDHFPVAATFQVLSDKSSIDDVERDQMHDVRYYNLNGQHLIQPRSGIYIEQQGKKTNKRVIK